MMTRFVPGEDVIMQNISDGNAMRMEISARSDNESFARVVVAAFCTNSILRLMR